MVWCMKFETAICWKILRWSLLASWSCVSLISLNHLYPVCPFLSDVPTRFLGWLGWIVIVQALFFFGRRHLRSLLLLGLLFFLLGTMVGSFLNPPADPLEHLRRVHEENCGKAAMQVPRSNRGLWHYSMAGVLLCTDGAHRVQPEKMLRRIDVTNGLFWALLAATLYILAVRSGLHGRWAFLSVLICFLFFGTNRFSYFRYYSLAPSFSSMIMFWLWTAVFFFKKKRRDIVKGLAVALLFIPTIWVNHQQEAVFLGFVVIVWSVLNISYTWGQWSFIPAKAGKWRMGPAGKFFTVNGAGFILLFAVCWLLPQFDFFLQWLARFFIREGGMNYQSVSVNWHGLYIGGRVAGLRVLDTFGGIGVLVLLVSVPYFWPGFARGSFEKRVRVFVLAVLPFIGYFVPLFHYIWSSNIIIYEYYRLCYMSMFWIVFADFFCSLEFVVCRAVSGGKPL